MATAGDIVTDALRLAGIISDENAASAVQMSGGLEMLNGMLSAWGTTSQTRAGTQRLTFTLTGSTITFGTGGDIATRIQGASSVWVNSGSIDYPLIRVSIQDYEQIAFKGVGGIPSVFCLDNGYPLNTMRLYPVPATGQILYVDAVLPMGEYTTSADDVALPPETRRAARYNLAIEFCAAYGADPTPALVRLAQDSYKVMTRAYRVPSNRFDSALPGVNTYNVRRNNGAIT